MAPTALDMKNNKAPPPKHGETKTHHFGIIEIEGRDCSVVPFILSKILDQKQTVL